MGQNLFKLKLTGSQVQEALNNANASVTEINNLKTTKQDKLISGTNIKTVNGQSILSEGNLEIITKFKDSLVSAKIGQDSVIFYKTREDGSIDETQELYNPSIKISEIENNLSNKANSATSLAGYGITDAFTKDEINDKLASVYKYKGSKNTKSELPIENNIIGDVWNVIDTDNNYAWTGTEWDKLGGIINLVIEIHPKLISNDPKTFNISNEEYELIKSKPDATVKFFLGAGYCLYFRLQTSYIDDNMESLIYFNETTHGFITTFHINKNKKEIVGIIKQLYIPTNLVNDETHIYLNNEENSIEYGELEVKTINNESIFGTGNLDIASDSILEIHPQMTSQTTFNISEDEYNKINSNKYSLIKADLTPLASTLGIAYGRIESIKQGSIFIKVSQIIDPAYRGFIIIYVKVNSDFTCELLMNDLTIRGKDEFVPTVDEVQKMIDTSIGGALAKEY